MLDILINNPLLFVILIICLVISITIHEFAHAFMTDRLGDYTARYYNRVTLDPRSHIDPYGLLFLVITGFGWGRPVPFNTINLKHPRRDMAIIALAGPMANFTLALVLSIAMRFIDMGTIITVFLYLLIQYNLVLAVFNLLPFHPLDGFKVMFGILPIELSIKWQQTEKIGIFILILLVLTGSLSRILTPLTNILSSLLGLSTLLSSF